MSILLLPRIEPLARWRGALTARLPDEVWVFDAEAAGATAVEVVISDVPPRGIWQNFPNLKLIQSLWMGVERWLGDATLPAHLPIARMIDPSMVSAMNETVVAHVLHAHLHHDDMRRHQRGQTWEEFFNPIANERRVGIMGLGNLGASAAGVLRQIGFQVNGWSRVSKNLEGVRCFAGRGELSDFLADSEIVVCLLPLTDATRAIADQKFFAAMRAGSVFINLGRGAHVVDADLLQALDRAHLRHAILDVFNEEPLPPAHPYWSHPRVTVTPHSASMANVETAAAFIAENVQRLRANQPLLGVVDREVGY